MHMRVSISLLDTGKQSNKVCLQTQSSTPVFMESNSQGPFISSQERQPKITTLPCLKDVLEVETTATKNLEHRQFFNFKSYVMTKAQIARIGDKRKENSN